MPNTIILNSLNLVKDQYQNRLIYKFPTSLHFDNHQIAIASIQMYYSWFNISSRYYNNTFTYTWFDNQIYTVTIPDGFYTIQTLNSYLQNIFVINKHYLVNSITRNNIYFLEFVTNVTAYSCQINAFPLSTSYATSNSWVLPSGASWTIPTSSKLCQINIGSNPFKDIIGFLSGSFPSLPGTVDTSIVYSSKSSTCPQVSPVNSLLVSCSLVNSSYGNPNNIIHSFAPNVGFGSMIDVKASEFAYSDIYKSHYTDFTLTFIDQNFQPVQIIDPSMVITLLIREKQ